MDKLKSEQDKLCLWLSEDPDYILDECGDILSANQSKQVQKQNSALEKTTLLLKMIIDKGADTCQSFVDILRKHQEHYPPLQQFFNPQTQGSPFPIVFADNSSVVNKRVITNSKGKSLNLKTEIVSAPGNRSCENVPKAQYIAQGGSAICVDEISGVTIDGPIIFSQSLKPSQVQAGGAEATPPLPKGPDVEKINKHRMELIEALRDDDLHILQPVIANGIVTDRQYQHLRNIPQPEQTVIKLIDMVISNGQEVCVQFLQVLKDRKILNEYPQLEKILKNMEA